VTNIAVACTTNTYTIGGTVSGSNGGTLVLQNNGGDNLSVNGDGPFTFATPVASGAAYAVTILTQPAGRVCTLGNASGTVGAGNVTDVGITCAAAPPQLALSVSDARDFARYGQSSTMSSRWRTTATATRPTSRSRSRCRRASTARSRVFPATAQAAVRPARRMPAIRCSITSPCPHTAP
jgi:hypothetical protein